MSLPEFVGSISLELDTREIEVVSVSVSEHTGNAPVVTMNKHGKISGARRGVRRFELRITAVIPLQEPAIEWHKILKGKLTIAADGGKRVSYRDCFAIEFGEEYSVDGEARRNIALVAADKVEE